jgi:hypothetical protein
MMMAHLAICHGSRRQKSLGYHVRMPFPARRFNCFMPARF